MYRDARPSPDPARPRPRHRRRDARGRERHARGVPRFAHGAAAEVVGGRTFRVHRRISVIGAGLLLAHPVPVVLARETTGFGPAAVFVPFAAERLAFNIAFGALALDALLVVLASSLLIKRLPRKAWRRLHYGAYAALAFGLYHGLLIPDDFGLNARNAPVNPLAIDKVLVELAIAGVVLAAAWRVAAAVHRRGGSPCRNVWDA